MKDKVASMREAVASLVNDGDTLTLTNGAKVRLVQVDAPELETDCYGRPALKALVALAPKGTRVRLVRDRSLDDRDRYGRLLRYVFVGTENVTSTSAHRAAHCSTSTSRTTRGPRVMRLNGLRASANRSRQARVMR